MNDQPFLAAAVQLCSTPDVEANEARAVELVRAAAARGADFVALPENWFYVGPMPDKIPLGEPLDGPRVERFAALADSLGIHLLLGSVPERSADPSRVYNTSVLLAPDGSTLAAYRKMHLFDVEIEGGISLRESDYLCAGDPEPVVARTALGTFGLSICYDLRFPELYRGLVRAGARLLTVPAAFTAMTGRDHWEVLLRARAIEGSAWVIAPNQWGRHLRGRSSYGRSMVIDPWGTVVACCPDREGMALAEVDPGAHDRVQRQIPSLRHRRL